ncbi:MAG: phytoene desaturase family protein [Polyangiaceae bacterium]
MTLNDYLVGIRWHDVIIVGAGHNGLVAALFLARKGLKVLVLEEKDVIGGAARTERPFANAPELSASTGAHLLGLMPPELIAKIGIELPLVRRDPHTFLPTTGARYVTFGSNPGETEQQLVRWFSEADWKAHQAMQAELGALRDDVAKTWLEAPLTIEATAETYVRKPLRQAFLDLCRRPAGEYIDRWGFRSDLLKAMYGVTAGLAGTGDPWTTPGSGMSFFVQAMCRLPDSGASWMVVKGGMGTVPRMIADEAVRQGVILETEAKVGHVVVENGIAKGVVLKDGTMHHATAVICNADPFRMRELVGRSLLPAEYNERLDGYRRDGGAMKVNLALSELPDFTCWPGGAFRDASRPFGATTHFLPDEKDALRVLAEGYTAAKQGKLPETPSIQMYLLPTLDPSSRDPEGRMSAALFVQPVPYELAGTTWANEEERYVKHLLSICDRFAAKMSSLVVDTFTLHPAKIEEHFGMTRGHVHHVDNGFGFADRLPYATPVQGLYSCSAGTHPAGSVIGAAGHNAAMRVLEDLGKASKRPPAL